MMPRKIKLQKYLKIRKGTKNVRNPRILGKAILHFFEFFKKKLGVHMAWILFK